MITPSDVVNSSPPPSTEPVGKDAHFHSAESKYLQIILEALMVCPLSPEELKAQVTDSDSEGKTCRRLFASHLPDLSSANLSTLVSNLDELLFERLMCSPDDLSKNWKPYIICGLSHFSKSGSFGANQEVELRQLHYLFQSFIRVRKVMSPGNNIDQNVLSFLSSLESALLNQSSRYLEQLDLGIYPSPPEGSKNNLLSLISEYGNDVDCQDSLSLFLEGIASRLLSNPDCNPVSLFNAQVYEKLSKRFEKISLMDPRLSDNLNLLHILTSGPSLGKVFLMISSPWRTIPDYDFKKGSGGRGAFMNLGRPSMVDDLMSTLLGRILSISCLSRPGNVNLEFFLNPSRTSPQEHQVTEGRLGSAIKHLVVEVHKIFLRLLKNKETKSDLLDWIGIALYALKDRSKMWTNELLMATGGGSVIQVSDGMILNLSHILLLLCQPFSSAYNPKLLKVDPRYGRGEEVPLNHGSTIADESKIHLRNLKDETFITGGEEDVEIVKSSLSSGITFNFMTEVFFFTQKALQMGFASCHERFLRLAQDLNGLQRMYEDARHQAMSSDPVVERMQEQLDKGMSQFLSMKTAIGQEEFVDLMMKFTAEATASWLNNLAACPVSPSEFSSDTPSWSHGFKKITREILTDVDNPNLSLVCIPEFILENITDVVVFIRRFRLEHHLNNIDPEPLVTLILIFMGYRERVKNPHLRAKFAEVLESLMPHHENDPHRPGQSSIFHSSSIMDSISSQIFTRHPHISELVPTLLRVFVSIEITGQSVAFEQKFQYRRPMYLVLKYLWREVKDPHRRRMIDLAREAEENLEATDAPLFLRFVNLLMNDANYLLDESLRYMRMLKEMAEQRDSGRGWDQNQQANFQHHGRLARFHNVIGRDTIETLSWLTDEVKTIFCSTTLVERIAQMLNYFLKFLVGSERKNFKLMGMAEMEREYDFRPADIVHDISLIYINLANEDNPKSQVFKESVSTDPRSFSPGLLTLAADVLLRTGRSENGLALKMRELSEECDRLQAESSAAEISIDDVPEEFVDSIMQTLMTDPVILPSSNKIVDRSTIARHLLSDQTDPFTRAPLSMSQVIPDVELKAKIDAFVREYTRKRLEANVSSSTEESADKLEEDLTETTA